jgi:hypothetical protein
MCLLLGSKQFVTDRINLCISRYFSFKLCDLFGPRAKAIDSQASSFNTCVTGMERQKIYVWFQTLGA